MKPMRLSRWQLVGVVLSIVWALGAANYTRNSDVASAENFVKFSYKVCADGKAIAHDADLSSCDQERAKNLDIWMKGSDANVVFTALVPIPLGWLAAFILIYIGRAQVAGFRAVVPWAALNWPKRAFVVFCAMAGFAAVVIGTTVILNLYVDTKVPVALSNGPLVTKTGDFVDVEGTWTRLGSSAGSSLAYPLQTSKIQCNKEQHRCTEARATVAVTNLLTSDLVEYDVESWTPASIVFRNDLPCATEVFTIDFNTDAVTGAGHPINKDSDYCKVYGGKEESWKYQLTNGFNVYWEQRQKARSLMLRLIQTFFGN